MILQNWGFNEMKRKMLLILGFLLVFTLAAG